MEEDGFRKNIAVVGLGLIGGSYAMALKKTGLVRVFGIDKDRSVLKKAEGCGVIDRGEVDARRILGRSDIVIISLYPKDTMDFIINNSKYFRQGAIITDVCGIKKPIIDAAQQYLPGTVEFVGGHPMAGNEFRGFEFASGELFQNTNYIITPHGKNSEKGLAVVESLAVSIGCKRVTKIEAAAHDRMMSLTSQLPHAIAISFASLAAGEPDMRFFTGRSFMDMIRVAALNKELWSQIFIMNKTNIIDRIEEMERTLKKLKNTINEKNEGNLQAFFDAAIKGKGRLDRWAL